MSESHQLLADFIDPRFDQFPAKLPLKKAVIYWMLREHRFHDNRGLHLAQAAAIKANAPLYIVSAFRQNLSQANMLPRTFRFIVQGLQEVEEEAMKHNISYVFLQGSPVEELVKFAHKIEASCIVTDCFPLPIYGEWQKSVQQKTQIPLIVVDGRNAVPIWITSSKQEYGARTIRPKIWSHFRAYEHLSAAVKVHPIVESYHYPKTHWLNVFDRTKFTECQFASTNLPQSGGAIAAEKALKDFVENRLEKYAEKRNDPAENGTSRLSAYIHFGQLSIQQIIEAIKHAHASKESTDSFLEEFIIRRELAENFGYYCVDPMSLHSAPKWAQDTLQKHQKDVRKITYTYAQFLEAKTHDSAWNAAQIQLLKTGYMHGYMRMYWAKKVLEWAQSPKQALEICIKLNDLLQLDGRSPNGYVGILWALAGVHDRPWFEREIFGVIRYMNFAGLKRKFNIDHYIARWETN